jgi:hypothetical protein
VFSRWIRSKTLDVPFNVSFKPPSAIVVVRGCWIKC